MLLYSLFLLSAVLSALKFGAWVNRRTVETRADTYDPPKVCFLRGKTLLVLANPFGGGGTGEWILRRVVQPMAEKAGVKVRAVVTTHKGHAMELAQAVDPTEVAAAVCISGDGMLNEFLNGLALRADGSLKSFPVAIVPGGTSNGMAASVAGRDPVEAMERILASAPRPVDVARVAHPLVPRPVVDCHVISWGIIADHDHLVERKLRWMGKWLRTQLAPLYVIALRRAYRGRVLMRPAPLDEEDVAAGMAPHDEWLRAQPTEERGGRTYHVLDDKVVLFSACNVRDAAHDAVFAPTSRPDDGSLHLLVMRQPSRLQLLRTFIGMGDGTHLKHPWVELFKVSGFILEPAEGNDLDLSGENYPLEKIEVEVEGGGMSMLW